MKIIELNKTNKNNSITAAIGIFDGFHKGHNKILNEIKERSPNAVLTFYKHPRKIKVLQSFSERLRKLRAFGINKVVVFTPRDRIMEMTASDFIRTVITKLDIKHIVIGSDFRFGHNRESNTDDLKGLCKKYNIELTIIDVIYDEGKKLSSTDIRSYVEKGDVKKAALLLGHNIELRGTVVKGKGNGAKIGFRTANIRPNYSRVLPGPGIYISIAKINNNKYHSVTFIGESPTIHKDHGHHQNTIIETHLINFEGDLYGLTISVELFEKLRDIKKFPTLEELKMAIAEDVKLAVKRLHSYE